jgi:ubiquinone/menaquinone biosynthesis C-methylase UbiE
MSDPAQVLRHYGRSDIRLKLDAALAAAGLGEGRLSPADLAPLDQFHTRGMAATIELGAALGIAPGTHGIDIGSGLGGPSRYLAARFGCHLQGIDLSPAFVEAATYLAGRAGLEASVSYECADALALPYDDQRFDFAWTQHVAMNIADRPRLYAETHRVMKPGGRFAIYDVVAGPGGEPHFPVPWSRTPETSFLVTPEAMRATLEQAGFDVVSWVDGTRAGVEWFAEQQKARAAAQAAGKPATPPPLGLHIAMGPDFPALGANLGRNLREDRVGIVQAIVQRR